ncbi:polysaccharide biosynthesis tyrosine autokinase [Pseudarthrobacter sp. S6]|uniref:polysaccharide biosynthesis tyrosine autokinase n=1 Tax=Pseudarthrobacter sp. S6 TaxID=3418420 RepID=UPI003CF8864B
MDLRAYSKTLRQNWVLLVSLTLVGLLASGVMSVLMKPTYTANAELFVAIQNSGSVQELQQGNTFSQARVQSYIRTVETPVVLQPVIDSLGLEVSSQQLSERVTASADLNTVLISIAVVDGSPARAAAIAQGVATSLISAVDRLESPKSGGTSPVSLSIIRPAEVPVSATGPNVRLNLLLGTLVGLGLGFGSVMLRTTLDNRIRGEADMRKVTDAPLLGAISFDESASKSPLMTQATQQSPRAESFRQLRTNLQFSNVNGGSRAVVVTSSLPGEGKSTTAANLAVAMAQSGASVCLVDADLRRPMIGSYLGLEGEVGLTTVLIGSAELDDVIQPWGEDNLFVVTSGRIPPNPSELLGSTAMRELVQRLEQSFDTVIIDAPPLLPVTDAAVLSSYVSGVVVVVGCKSVRQNELEKALTALRLVGARTLGVVLNLLPSKGTDAYSYGYYSSSPEADRERDQLRPSSIDVPKSSEDIKIPTSPPHSTEELLLDEAELESLPRRLRNARTNLN